MKKFFLLIFFVITASFITKAQQQPIQKQKTETKDTKAKVKPKTTVNDKVYNVIHRKHKKSHGIESKQKTPANKTKND